MKILHQFNFTIQRHEANFDRACDSARNYALSFLGADEDGNFGKIKEWCRSTDSLAIEFVDLIMTGNMTGWDYAYVFKCTAYRTSEEA